MRIAFAGSPDFAANILSRLINSPYKPICVYTQPDRRAGRGQKMQPSAVKMIAEQAHVPVEQPRSLRQDDAKSRLQSLNLDLLLVVAYGLILPKDILELPKQGCINVHASLLPRWRGAAPIERAYMAGDERTGVSIMRMDEGLDTGPVYIKRDLPIRAAQKIAELHDQLCTLGGDALIEVLSQFTEDSAPVPAAQTEQGACYAPKLTAQDRVLDWALTATQLARQINALSSRMPVRCHLAERGLQLLGATAIATPTAGQELVTTPGEIVAHSDGGFVVNCATDKLLISEVKLEGKGAMDAAAALRGYPDVFQIGNKLT